MLSSSAALTQISQWRYRSEPPIPSCSSSRLDRQQSHWSRRLWSCHRVSVFEISALHVSTGTKSSSRGSLIRWAKCYAVSTRSNLSWARYDSLIQADPYRVASSFFRIGLHLPSNTSFVLQFLSWCAHRFSVRIASWFTGGEWTVSQIKFNIQVCPVWSTPTLNSRLNNSKLFTSESSESKCSHVFRCVFGFEQTIDVFESIIIWQTQSSPCTAFLTSWIGLWNNAALCLPLRKPPNSPQIRFTQSSCQVWEASWLPCILLINLPTLSSPYFWRSSAGSRM